MRVLSLSYADFPTKKKASKLQFTKTIFFARMLQILNEDYFIMRHIFKNKINVLLACSVTVLIAGCARNISSDTYSDKHVDEATQTYAGRIVSVRKVQVKAAEKLEENTTGAAIGAIAGGVAGYQFGGGRGQVAATGAGALLGGIAGAFAQDALGSQEALEYVVQLESGALRTVVQGLDPALSPGQNVLLMVSMKGRSRVIAING